MSLVHVVSKLWIYMSGMYLKTSCWFLKFVEHSKDYFKIKYLLITEVCWISEGGLKIKSFYYDDDAWWKGEIVSRLTYSVDKVCLTWRQKIVKAKVHLKSDLEYKEGDC